MPTWPPSQKRCSNGEETVLWRTREYGEPKSTSHIKETLWYISTSIEFPSSSASRRQESRLSSLAKRAFYEGKAIQNSKQKRDPPLVNQSPLKLRTFHLNSIFEPFTKFLSTSSMIHQHIHLHRLPPFRHAPILPAVITPAFRLPRSLLPHGSWAETCRLRT